jgi:hypothetical protein
MCALTLLADLAEQEGGLHHVKMACLFAVGKIWSGSTVDPQMPTLGGVAVHFYGEHLAVKAPNRLATTVPPIESKEVPTITGIAGASDSGRRMTLVVSQYDAAIPNEYGPSAAMDVVWDGLRGGPFQYVRWAYRGVQSGLPLEVGVAEGTRFERLGIEMVGNTIETWMLRYCPQDVNDSGVTDIDDLLLIVTGWGPVAPLSSIDITADAQIDTNDLLAVIDGWGVCGQ